MGTLGWGQDPGVRSCQPSGHAAREPAWVSSQHPRVPGLGWGPATPRPVPPLPLTSPDVQGEGHQQAEPRAAGPPGSRCQAPRHPGAHPSHRRRGLGRRLRWPLAARHLPRPLGAGPTPPAGSRPPPARPPASGSGSQTMEREQELEVGGTLSTWAAPPPRRVLVPYGSPSTRRPHAQSREESHFSAHQTTGDGPVSGKRDWTRSVCSLLEAPDPGGKSHFLCLSPRPTSRSPVKASDI